MPAKMICGFVDADVNRLLEVDAEREVAFSLVALGHVAALAQQLPSKLSALHLETVPLSRNETVYPAMHEIHTASSLNSAQEVEIWRVHAPLPNLPTPTGPIVQLHPYSDAEMSRDPIERVILRRGSARMFAQVPIELRQLSTMLDRATRGIPADFLDPQGTQLNDLYLIVNAVEGLEPGAYVYHRDGHVLECLKAGNFRTQAGHLGLDQELPAEAAADIFFLADLQMILGSFGNRGYRAVQLEAGILSGKLYLGAYAQHMSATGLTFYDDEVIRFFSPHAYGRSVIMLVAVGKNAKSLR
jgi:SagB-type dehydrogenase family enzyme